MSLHPYQQLRECSTINFFQGNTDTFKSKVEEAIEYCVYRTVTPLSPVRQETPITNWTVDWKLIICMIQWSDLFLNHNSSSNADGATALTQVCSTIQNVVWMEHTERLNTLKQFYKDETNNMLKQFNDTQLQLIQNTLLDIWMDNSNTKVDKEVCYDQDADEIVIDTNKDKYTTIPSLTRADRFMLQFIIDQITRPFIQLSDKTDETSTLSINIWNAIIQKYTSSLCCDIKSLFSASKNNSKLEEVNEEDEESEGNNSDMKLIINSSSNLDPIANLLSKTTSFVDGHDADTRIELFNVLISKARRWVELLMGLEREHKVVLSSNEKGQYISDTLVNDIVKITTTLKDIGAMSLILKDKKECTSLNDPLFPLVMIRLIEAGINSKMNAYRTRVKVRQEIEEHMMTQLDDTSDCSARKATSISNRCIIKKCNNMGYWSSCGMCRPHAKASKQLQPSPFNWVDYPQDKLQKIMKILKRRRGGISSKANLSQELLKEASRMSMQKKRRKRRRLKPPTVVKTSLHWTREA